jgi:DNA-binding protein YbaB
VEQDEDYEVLLAEQRTRLARIRAEGAPASTQDAEGQEGVGSSGDGAVRVVMRDRRVTSVVIGVGVTGRSRSKVAELLREAINQAMTQSLAQSPRAGDPGPNLAALGNQLTEFAQESGQALRRIQGAVEQSMAKLAGKVQIRGDASPQYVDFLFEDALEVVRSMQAALDDGASAPVTGEGRDESDEVAATVSQGELTKLMLTGFALQMPPDELGQAVQEAVNDALTEWERHSAAADRQPSDPEALRQLAERASAVRQQSMQHLRTYTDSMTAIMRNVD